MFDLAANMLTDQFADLLLTACNLALAIIVLVIARKIDRQLPPKSGA